MKEGRPSLSLRAIPGASQPDHRVEEATTGTSGRIFTKDQADISRPDVKDLHARSDSWRWKTFFIKRARAHSRAERKEMIDREHPLSLTRQRRILELSGRVCITRKWPFSDRDLELMRPYRRDSHEISVHGSRSIRISLKTEDIR